MAVKSKQSSKKQEHRGHKARNIVHKAIHKKQARKFKKFCPKCGNPVDRGIFCKDCRKADFEFKEMKIILCNSCNSYFHRNKWTSFRDFNQIIKKIVRGSTKAKVTPERLDEAMVERISSYKAGIKTDITLGVDHKKEFFDIPARLEITLCAKCSKKGTTYFESVLQLRNANDEVMNFVRHEIAKHHSKGIYINKEVRLDKSEDIDLYLTKKNYAVVLAEKVKKNFGGAIKKNAKLFSIDWETSKNQYRLNVLLVLPNFSKGDVIKQNADLFKIISIGDSIHVQNLKTNAKTSLPYKSYDILKPSIFQLIKRYPEHEVLDPITYYQVRLMNPSNSLEIDQRIRCVIDGGEAWMV